MKLSARNQLKGKIISVEKDEYGVMAKVKLEIDTPGTITALISKEAVDDLNLAEGDDAYAIIKSTSVILGKDVEDS